LQITNYRLQITDCESPIADTENWQLIFSKLDLFAAFLAASQPNHQHTGDWQLGTGDRFFEAGASFWRSAIEYVFTLLRHLVFWAM
jgi:hypothetical protein